MLKRLLSVVILLLLSSQSAFAQLSVSPKRVIFEGRERSHELLLLNTGDQGKTYRMYFRELMMTAQGGYEVLTQPNSEHKLASQAVRFSPRQVTLAPGASQTVRLLVRKPKGFVDGEYRSHLTFSEVPEDDFGQSIEGRNDNQGFAFQMRPLLGMSIPVIIRQGRLSQAVEIKKATLNGQQLALELHRLGDASVYGLLSATFTPNNGDAVVELGRVKGVSVLTPLAWRNVSIPLDKVPSEPGILQISYTDLESAPATQLAQARLNL